MIVNNLFEQMNNFHYGFDLRDIFMLMRKASFF